LCARASFSKGRSSRKAGLGIPCLSAFVSFKTPSSMDHGVALRWLESSKSVTACIMTVRARDLSQEKKSKKVIGPSMAVLFPVSKARRRAGMVSRWPARVFEINCGTYYSCPHEPTSLIFKLKPRQVHTMAACFSLSSNLKQHWAWCCAGWSRAK
jgi:hypothetical protein